MTRSLHRRIAKAAWSDFERILEYKATVDGATVTKVPADGIRGGLYGKVRALALLDGRAKRAVP